MGSAKPKVVRDAPQTGARGKASIGQTWKQSKKTI